MVVCAMRLAENLRQGASHFQRQSDDMRRLMWWRNFKMKCIVFLLVFSIVRLPHPPTPFVVCASPRRVMGSVSASVTPCRAYAVACRRGLEHPPTKHSSPHCGHLLCDGGVQVGYIVVPIIVNVYKTTHSDDDKD